MGDILEPEKGIGDIVYDDGEPYIIQQILDNGEYVCIPHTRTLDDTGSSDNDKEGNADDDDSQSTKTCANDDLMTIPKRKAAKKVYRHYSRDEERKMIQDWMIHRPRKGKDTRRWKTLASLISTDLKHLAYQRHLCLMINNRIKYNQQENVTSGEEPHAPTDEEQELDKCIEIWNDIHEADEENVKKLANDIRAAAVQTMNHTLATSSTKLPSPVSRTLSGRQELVQLMTKHEDRQERQQDFFAQTLSLKKQKLDIQMENSKSAENIQLKQIELKERQLAFEEKKLLFEERKFNFESEINKVKATQEAEERSLLIQMLLKQKNNVFYTYLTIIWGYKMI